LQGELADLMWKMDAREEALARVEHVVQVEPGYNWAWDALRAWSHELECSERANEAARKITTTRAGEARSWLILARTLQGPNDLDERLAALDKAVELNPRSVAAHDLRAELLVEVGRFDEALAACRPATWDGHGPILLRSRAAAITADQGRVDEAISELRTALDEEPSYYPGWMMLADWYRQDRNSDEYLEVAQTLVRLAPQNEISYGYLGEALLMTGEDASARDAFERAFEVAPDYEFAGLSLFDMQLEANELDKAAKTVQTLDLHVSGPFVKARAVQVAAKQNDRGTAIELLRELCTTETESAWPINTAVEAMNEAKWAEPAKEVLTAALDDTNAHHEVGALWVRQCWPDRDKSCESRLQGLVQQGCLGEPAIYTWFELLAQAGDAKRLNRYIKQNTEWLRKTTWCWACAGYALATLRNYSQVAMWMRDWQEREHVEPWMLVNAVEGFRGVGQMEQAVEAGQYAISLPSDHAYALHSLWLATDDVLAGNIEQAAQGVDGIDPTILDSDYLLLHTIIESVIQMANAKSSERSLTFREVRNKLQAFIVNYKELPHEPARRKAYHQALKEIARYRGGVLATLWYWWKRLTTNAA